jgi:hypothetical protein
MLPPFDLFKQEPNGTLRWLGAMPDVETGKAKAQELMRSTPGEYFVFSQTTGNKFHVDPEESDIKDTPRPLGRAAANSA